ncbi:hypothetical protein [Xenorhabdus taiwanensis]|uniref:Transposase n=1 Tax=Xenorhabdus taiwanensis TaxID=3085177 RepID=A0ABM8K054_9GAMM|nr:hypothetical protein TCT1_18850 [Xenorhabdus sp. TCT-1]
MRFLIIDGNKIGVNKATTEWINQSRDTQKKYFKEKRKDPPYPHGGRKSRSQNIGLF